MDFNLIILVLALGALTLWLFSEDKI